MLIRQATYVCFGLCLVMIGMGLYGASTPDAAREHKRGRREGTAVEMDGDTRVHRMPAESGYDQPYKIVFDIAHLSGGATGSFEVVIYPEWSMQGSQHLRHLVDAVKLFDDSRFFRVMPGKLVQFGIPADPVVSEKWCNTVIPDEPIKHNHTRGTIAFSSKPGRKNTRTTQLFINLKVRASCVMRMTAPVCSGIRRRRSAAS